MPRKTFRHPPRVRGSGWSRSRRSEAGTPNPILIAVAILISQSLLAQTPRLEVIHAMLQRPNDPWPRGKGHVVLAVPGCLEANKGYHEPGAGFSPSFGSFGVSIWITDKDGKIETTSDRISLEDIRQELVWKRNRELP